MEFQTKISIPYEPLVDYKSELLLMGSCFAENIGERLNRQGFRVQQNPFGILYQPSALLRALKRIIHLDLYQIDELVFHDGLFHSPDHHGRFSGIDAASVIDRINTTLKSAHALIHRKDPLLMMTFGSIWGYVRKSDQKPFSNCHKIPGSEFIKTAESIDEIRKNWNEFLQQLHNINPTLQILFTVSPVRHWKDGAIENQLSKSTLLVCLHEWVHSYPFCHYFPSYEIMMDELRDYRFYKDDMIHPSTLAEEYIWEKFVHSRIRKEDLNLFRQIQDLFLRIQHRPLHPERPEIQEEMHKIALSLNDLESREPHPDLQVLKDMLQLKMNTYA